MIHRAELKEIGTLRKPHGINGEINAESPLEADELAALRCVVLEIDGIFVPFFISAARPKSARVSLITIDGIDSDAQAEPLCPAPFYALRDDIRALEDRVADEDAEESDGEYDDDADGFYAEDLIGYTATTDDGRLTGTIEDIDDTTANYLFVIRDSAGRRVLIPVADGSMITGADHDARAITLSLPEGLLDLNG